MFNLEFLGVIRGDELNQIIPLLPRAGSLVLELGAGAGHQARMLEELGHDVRAIDTDASNYRDVQVFPVTSYDGVSIPFDEATFDVVFSSNVLEHVRELPQLLAETERVLKPQGRAIHILPTHTWRVATTLSAFVDAPLWAWAQWRGVVNSPRGRVKGALRSLASPLFQRRHGEHGNVLTEVLLFRPIRWQRLFAESGWTIIEHHPMRLFYTGNMVLGPRLSLERRATLAKRLGSACHVFVLQRDS